jgi:hypothetical protein
MTTNASAILLDMKLRLEMAAEGIIVPPEHVLAATQELVDRLEALPPDAVVFVEVSSDRTVGRYIEGETGRLLAQIRLR